MSDQQSPDQQSNSQLTIDSNDQQYLLAFDGDLVQVAITVERPIALNGTKAELKTAVRELTSAIFNEDLVDRADDAHRTWIRADGGQPVSPEHDFVLTVGNTGRTVYHWPDPEDPENTRCDRNQSDSYRRIGTDRIPEYYDCCQYCNPDVEIDTATHGTKLADKLHNMELEDAGDDELVTDGGVELISIEPGQTLLQADNDEGGSPIVAELEDYEPGDRTASVTVPYQ